MPATADRLDAIDLLSALVSAQSPNPPGDERAIARVITDAASVLGLPAPQVTAREPHRPNLLIRIEGTGPRLLIAGHMDTMPPGDLASWHSDPFTLSRSGGRLSALGVADMKSGIAAALLAAGRLVRDHAWHGSLDLLFTADEENCSEYGMKWLAGQGVLAADGAIILEPAGGADARSWERLFIAQRGSAVVTLVASGRPGHSAAQIPPGERAGVALARAMTALAGTALFADVVHPVDGTGPMVNIGTMIGGGVTPFMHPEKLTATVEVRIIEGMTMEQVHEEIRRVIGEAGLADRVEVVAAASPLDWFPPGPAVRDRRLLSAAEHGWQSVLGTRPSHGVLPGATDSCWLSMAGIPALPALGCGSLAVAHQPGEWILERELTVVTDLTEAIARAFADVRD